jgi:hypothetical protein
MTIGEYAKTYGLKQMGLSEWYESEMKDGTTKMHHVDDIAAHILYMNEDVEQDKYKYNKRIG